MPILPEICTLCMGGTCCRSTLIDLKTRTFQPTLFLMSQPSLGEFCKGPTSKRVSSFLASYLFVHIWLMQNCTFALARKLKEYQILFTIVYRINTVFPRLRLVGFTWATNPLQSIAFREQMARWYSIRHKNWQSRLAY